MTPVRTAREPPSPTSGGFEVTSAEYSATGQIQNSMCRLGQDDLDTIVPCVGAGADKVNYGHTYPQWEVGIQNSFRVGQDLRVSARVDFQGGAWGVNHDHLATVVSFANTFHAVTPATFPIYDSYRTLVGRPPLGFLPPRLREASLGERYV